MPEAAARVPISAVERLFSSLPDTLRPQQDQPFAVQVEVHQSEVRAQPVVVLRYPPVSRLVEAEDAFQYPENMFYFCSYSRLSRVLAPGFFVRSEEHTSELQSLRHL